MKPEEKISEIIEILKEKDNVAASQEFGLNWGQLNHYLDRIEEVILRDLFIFRGEDCNYSIALSKDSRIFYFGPPGDEEFIDHRGKEYFIECEYFDNIDPKLDSAWRFWRLYESGSSANACDDFFPDKLTEEECKQIKAFMLKLMETGDL